ncbi:RNA methyltransferase [Staphylococcus schleiferi subsp. coagulans]|uniref:TrmH family RNA methyltransferase n=1 Tax=Staphylococcus coagulans TaxID=74706 RepID=UPI0015FD3C6B|nr:RNA methyltransferase [Staphylococcus coagulans]MBA8759301.1 RNA methyltransferase [Staphylococcus coagulans]MBA8767919.1 RNA methyltransferase [Staphylococcus coagulans]
MEQITSIQNAKIKNFNKLKKKRERDKQGLAIIEGPHLIEAAYQSGIKIKQLFMIKPQRVDQEMIQHTEEAYEITQKVAESLSGTMTPQGVFAVIEKSEVNTKQAQQVLILDRIQDPGNLGTLIRTADAAGLDLVILTKGTADVYQDKVLRASQGSVFHIPIQVVDNVLDFITHFDGPIYGTALEEATVYHQVPTRQSRFGLIVGNEGQGVAPELLQHTTQNLTIPIYGQAESLNVAVAAGVLMFYLKG